MSRAVTNCPNCGAPLRHYGRCDYCGTSIVEPLQCITVRPGTRRIACQMLLPIDIAIKRPDDAVEYAKRDMCRQIADALTEAVKFTVRKDFDPERFEEMVCIRGELFVTDPEFSRGW